MVLVPSGVFKKKKLVSIGLTAQVEPLAPGSGTPAGTITFKVKKKTLGSVSLSGGMATLTVKAASVLKKAVTIIYTGDGNFTSTTVTPTAVSQGALKSVAKSIDLLLALRLGGRGRRFPTDLEVDFLARATP